MDNNTGSIVKIAGYILGAAALVPLAYYGVRFVVETRCPECDARLEIVKRPGSWEPDLVPGDDD